MCFFFCFTFTKQKTSDSKRRNTDIFANFIQLALANRLNLFSVSFWVWFRDLISTTWGRLGYTLSRHILSVSHLTTDTHKPNTMGINSDVSRIQDVGWFMCFCFSLTAFWVSLSLPPSVLPSIFAYLCPSSSSSSPSIPLPSLPYFPHHHQHGKTSASWQHI